MVGFPLNVTPHGGLQKALGKRGIEIKLAPQLCLTLWNPWTVTHQAPLSMDFSKQEYCSGLLFPFPWDLPDSQVESGSHPL